MARIKRLATKARISLQRLFKARRQRKTPESASNISALIDAEVHKTSNGQHKSHGKMLSHDHICLTGELNDTGDDHIEADRPQSRDSPLPESVSENKSSESTASETNESIDTGVAMCENKTQQDTQIMAPKVVCPREQRSDFSLDGFQSKSEEDANDINKYNFEGPAHHYGICTLFRDSCQLAETETSFEHGVDGGDMAFKMRLSRNGASVTDTIEDVSQVTG
ncbi:uncharacterized protein J3D65DRAFT_616427 [Phyllosticta citribraziliensis]|uniref:Uncharacterized protein n=1 Tax=Phyllosticta citribraziliensis TaxID=989973 RepID=A0ABR1M3T7_9PEZI